MGVVARAHDLLVNTDMGDVKQPEWMVRVKEDYFKAGESMFKSRELSELLDEMDQMGVERSVLMMNMGNASKRVLSFVDDHQIAYTVIGPSFWGDGMYAPGDAVYYPLYTKCCELDLPLCGIDLKRAVDGTFFCFEVNPSPAYSYYQDQTGQPIADALVDYLAGTNEEEDDDSSGG